MKTIIVLLTLMFATPSFADCNVAKMKGRWGFYLAGQHGIVNCQTSLNKRGEVTGSCQTEIGGFYAPGLTGDIRMTGVCIGDASITLPSGEVISMWVQLSKDKDTLIGVYNSTGDAGSFSALKF